MRSMSIVESDTLIILAELTFSYILSSR